jgi:glycosyltransferase involved in cell wall biosynthesis
MPRFSVIIPTHNRAPVVRDAIESVLTQTLSDYEIIVVDDGSTDDTAALLKEYKGRLTCAYQQNAGAAAARNRGIEMARGRFIAFLDSDDAWAPWTIETLACAVEQFGSPALVAGRGASWASRPQVRREALQCRSSQNFLAASRAQSAFYGMPGLAIRADVLRTAGGFRERLRTAEDQDLCLRLGDAIGFVQIDAPIVFFQRTDLEHLSGHVGHAIDAVDVVIEGERQGRYPGGTELARTRRAMICALARRTAVMCSRAGKAAAALRIYRRCFAWHVALQRWRFLLGFPLLIARSAMRRA